MNERTLRAVFIGCGGFAANYLPAHGSLPFVRPVLCVDAQESAARTMAKCFEEAQYTTEFSRAVECDADFALVSTPNDLHVEHASSLLLSGKHVLLQKPMARNTEEARRLLDARRQSGRRLGLYMSMLDFGLWWQVREAISKQQVLGEICQVSMRLGHTGGLLWNAQPGHLWRFSRERTGGGAFIMLGVHFIHFSRWLLGLDIRRVCAQVKNLHCPRVEGEDICQVQGEFSNGALVQLGVAWNSQGEHLALYGTEGSLLYLDNEILRLRGTRPWKTDWFSCEPADWQTYHGVKPPAFGDGENPFNQQRQFAESVRDDRPPPVDAAEGLRDLAVVDAVYRSAATGRWEDVNDGS
jgi:UDP-N-acetyl-2-amino-2-deoxyglucuronate dehydrogenase